jgi:hypothetical protein
MAKTTARRVDRPSGTTPTVEQSGNCEMGYHAACRGEIVSLLVPVGTPCDCPCHWQGVAA